MRRRTDCIRWRHVCGTWMSHVARVKESCHTSTYVAPGWVMLHVWRSHVIHSHTCAYVARRWVMSHLWMSHVTRVKESCDSVKESCRTCEGIMSYSLKESCRTCVEVMSYIYIHARGWSCHTCEGVMTKYLLVCPRVSGWVMSHVWRSHDKTSTYVPKGEWVSNVTRVNESWHISTYVHVCRVWHQDESCHICDGVVTKIYIRRVCVCVYTCVTFCICALCVRHNAYIHICMHVCVYVYRYVYTYIYVHTKTHMNTIMTYENRYGVATISRLLKIKGFCCRISSLL